ncbi:MAG: DUF5663 domain-containing protein [Candidatus Nomurabacteria bacterium]|jgi:hypothetical protein|nr:DUF5663 domain-containing protein [Candidatus Nomurabacteria bacterium]
MFQLDEQFLEAVGLSGMDPKKKTAFLAHTQEELEVRIGMRMSEGLTDNQVTEFEQIISNNKDAVNAVIGSTDLKKDKTYQLLITKAGFKDSSDEIRNEYASIKWLTENRPDYQELVSGEIEKLKQEIIDNREKIL